MYFLGCLVDHEDNSKRWCSTKVDSNNNHIANQNEYGYCADNCPTSSGEDIIIDDTTENPILDKTTSTGKYLNSLLFIYILRHLSEI